MGLNLRDVAGVSSSASDLDFATLRGFGRRLFHLSTSLKVGGGVASSQ